MAFEVTLVGGLPNFAAATDLSAKKDLFVNINAIGVTVADVRSTQTSIGRAYVLDSSPTSGNPAALHGAPNIKKVIAGEAITLGNFVQVMSATGLAGKVATGSDTYRVGVAWSTAAGSGEYLSVQLV